LSTSSAAPSLFWFRQDLRLADNPALTQAAERGGPLVCVFVLDDETPGAWAPGGASRWWLHHSLAALDQALRQRGSRLVLRRGPAAEVMAALAEETGARQVFWNRCYEPFAVRRDTALKAALQDGGRAVQTSNAALLLEPWEVKTGGGEPYKVFTPFWRALKGAYRDRAPLPAPKTLPDGMRIASAALEDWALLPTKPDWAGGLRARWSPGEAGAQARLRRFLQARLGDYREARDRPDLDGTSCLSPHLHFGEIGPRQVWHATRHALAAGGGEAAAEKFLSELAWREFSQHLLFHFPALPEANWRGEFDAVEWRDDAAALAAWQRGRTGYPIVDAGLRELWATGWMHNRVRMIAASFLIKDLLIDWRAGQAWFWDTLVDADLGNNAAGWQWVAGSGADAAPYFRVFNPVLQGERFDPAGDYVRRWVPELARLPAKWIHKPWEADAATLGAAGVTLGRDYPERLVAHDAARRRALDAFATVKQGAA
jgi:deoxyribodipyrimidine photo-lyase